MKCSICYELFIKAEDYSKDDYLKLAQKAMINSEEFLRLHCLLITNTRNELLNTQIFRCHTPGCNAVFCCVCYIKIKSDGDEACSLGDKFKCPYCRNIDLKDYMKHNVLNQMMCKILKPEEIYARCMGI